MPTTAQSPSGDPSKDTGQLASTAAFLALSKAVFYFDLSPEQSHVIGLLGGVLPRYGARLATFLDKNVTHFVTDKASTIVEAHANTIKWKMTMLSLPQFLLTVMINMERAGDSSLDAFKRAVQSKGRDLLQCLEEERRTSNKLKPARMTPLYAAAQTNAATAAATTQAGMTPHAGTAGKITTAVKPTSGSAQKSSRQAHFKQFADPFVLIEEGDLYLAPIHKQYPPHPKQEKQPDRVSFPVIRWESSAPHCPFSYSARAREDGKYWSDLLVDLTPRLPRPLPVPAIETKQKVTVTVKDDKKTAKVPNKRASFGGDPAKRKDFSGKPKPGYCECCYEKYEKLRPHIITTKHREFATCAKNYAAVDDLLSRLIRAPLIDAVYNPILAWSTAKAAAASGHAAVHMSPAHSTILSQCTRRSALSALHTANGPPLLEDKENDLPSGLDLTGLDHHSYLTEKRRMVSSDGDVFQEPDPSKRKFRRIGLKQL